MGLGAPYAALPYATLEEELAASSVATGSQLAPCFLLVAEPWFQHAAGGAAVTFVFASTNGYVSVPDGTGVAEGIPDHQLFPGSIISPGNLSLRLLSVSGFAPSALPTMGNVVLANPDRHLDEWLRMDWARRRVRVWVGENRWMGPSFGEFQQRLTASGKTMTADTDTMTLSLEPMNSMDVSVNEETYGGFNAALRLISPPVAVTQFMGSDDFIPGTSSFSLRVRVRKIDRGPSISALVTQKNTLAATDPGWAIYLSSTEVDFRISDGTNQVTARSTAGSLAISDQTMDWHDMIVVVDQVADLAYLHMDGELLDTEDISSIGAVITGQTVHVGSLASGFSPATADFDEVCIFNKALTDDEIKKLWGGPTPNGHAGLIAAYHCDAGAGQKLFNSSDLPGAVSGLNLSGGAYIEFPGVSINTVEGFAIEIESSMQSPPLDVLTLFSKGRPIGSVSPGVALVNSPFLPDDGIIAVAYDGTTMYVAAWEYFNTPGFDASVLHRYALEVDRVNQVLRVLVDGVEKASTSIAGAGSFDSADPIRVGIDGGALFPMEGRVSDLRYFTAPRSSADYVDFAGKRLTGFEPDLRLYAKIDDGSGTTVTDSSVHGDDGTIVTAGGSHSWYETHTESLKSGSEGTNYDWVGSAEGGTELAGKRRRKVWGIRRQLNGDLVDPQRVVYEVCDLPCKSIVPFLDGAATLAYAGDFDDIYDWTSVAGQYATCLARGQVRFHSQYAGTVTFDVEGDSRSGYTANGPTIMQRIATLDAGLPLADVDQVSVANAAASRPGALGIATDHSKAKASELLNRIAQTLDGWWTFDIRDGRWTVGLRDEPEAPELTIDGDIVRQAKVKRSDAGVLARQVRIRYRPFDVTHSLEDVPGSLPEADRLLMTQPYRVAESEPMTDQELTRHPAAEVIEIETLYDLEDDARTEAERRFALDKVPRALWEVSLAEVSYRLRVGMPVLLKLAQAGLDDGRRLLLGTLTEDEKGNSSTFMAWGARDAEDEAA